MACGPLDELVALHEELGIRAALDGLAVERERAGLADGLLLRTLAALPFLREAALGGAAGALFRSRPSCSSSAGRRPRSAPGAISAIATRRGGRPRRCPAIW